MSTRLFSAAVCLSVAWTHKHVRSGDSARHRPRDHGARDWLAHAIGSRSPKHLSANLVHNHSFREVQSGGGTKARVRALPSGAECRIKSDIGDDGISERRCQTEYEPHRFARWATLLPSRREIVLLLCAAIVQIELRGRQEQTLHVHRRHR